MGKFRERKSQGLGAAFRAEGIVGVLERLLRDDLVEDVARWGRGPADAPDLAARAPMDDDLLVKYLPRDQATIRADLLAMVPDNDEGGHARAFAETLVAMAQKLPAPERYLATFPVMMENYLALASTPRVAASLLLPTAPRTALPGSTGWTTGTMNPQDSVTAGIGIRQ